MGITGMTKSLLDITRMTMDGAEKFANLPATYGKPIVAIRFRRSAYDIVIDILKGGGIPVYDTPEECARAMAALANYAAVRRRG